MAQPVQYVQPIPGQQQVPGQPGQQIVYVMQPMPMQQMPAQSGQPMPMQYSNQMPGQTYPQQMQYQQPTQYQQPIQYQQPMQYQQPQTVQSPPIQTQPIQTQPMQTQPIQPQPIPAQTQTNTIDNIPIEPEIPIPPFYIACWVKSMFSKDKIKRKMKNKSVCFNVAPILFWCFGILFLIGAIALKVSGPEGIMLLIISIILIILAIWSTIAYMWGTSNGYDEGIQYPELKEKKQGVVGKILGGLFGK
mmetsp:Transcript_44767/g.54812  ORF Transcript_44767/g.54812 Transcript_44767/m.54812 type:complete len:247 (+) Transcript_44767:45-785(+)